MADTKKGGGRALRDAIVATPGWFARSAHGANGLPVTCWRWLPPETTSHAVWNLVEFQDLRAEVECTCGPGPAGIAPPKRSRLSPAARQVADEVAPGWDELTLPADLYADVPRRRRRGR